MAVRAGLLRKFGSSLLSSSKASSVVHASSIPSTILYITGLNKRTTSDSLKEAFSKFSEVVSARVVRDKVSGCSKSFGFVRYATKKDAEKGLKGMDGEFLDGWVIVAVYARPRAPREPSLPPNLTNKPR